MSGEELWRGKEGRNQPEPERKLLQAVNENNLKKVMRCLEPKPKIGDSDGFMNAITTTPRQVNPNLSLSPHNQWSLLHLACCHVNPEIAAVLIKHGANLNARTSTNETPLHFAAEKSGDAADELVRVLVTNGADVNAIITEDNDEDSEDDTEEEEQEEGGPRKERKKSVNDHPEALAGTTPLLIASEEENVGICRLLLEHGAGVGAYDSQGYTALHYAVKKKNIKLCQLLVEHGADPNFMPTWKDYYTSPLHMAAASSFQLSELLLTHNGDPHLQDYDGDLPLHKAVKTGERTVRLFVHHMLLKNSSNNNDNNNNNTQDLHKHPAKKRNIMDCESGDSLLTQYGLNNNHNNNGHTNGGASESSSSQEWGTNSEESVRSMMESSGELIMQLKNRRGQTALDCVPGQVATTDRLRLAFFGGVRSLKEYCGLFLLEQHPKLLGKYRNRRKLTERVGGDLVNYMDNLARKYFPQRFPSGLYPGEKCIKEKREKKEKRMSHSPTTKRRKEDSVARGGSEPEANDRPSDGKKKKAGGNLLTTLRRSSDTLKRSSSSIFRRKNSTAGGN